MIGIGEIRTAVVGCMLFELLGMTLLPSAARAECSQWDMNGHWTFVQTNGARPDFELRQTDTGLQGQARFSYLTPDQCILLSCGDDLHGIVGSVDGSISGNLVEINAYWGDGSIGVYTGTIGSQGRIQGTTFDRMNPQTMASWYSTTTADCLPNAAVEVPPPKAPIAVPFDSTTPARRPFPVN